MIRRSLRNRDERRDFSVRRRRFSDELEQVEEKAEDVIEEKGQGEVDGVKSAEDIAVLVMAIDNEVAKESDEVMDLLEKVTGLPEEGVEMILDIKEGLDKDDSEEKKEESFSKARRVVNKFKRERRFSVSRRTFDEEDVEIIADSLDDDFEDYFEEDEVVDAVQDLMSSRRMSRLQIRSILSKTMKKKFSRRRSSRFSGRSRMLPGTRLESVRERRFSNLVPSRTENNRMRKIENSRERVSTIRPRDKYSPTEGYFSRESLKRAFSHRGVSGSSVMNLKKALED